MQCSCPDYRGKLRGKEQLPLEQTIALKSKDSLYGQISTSISRTDMNLAPPKDALHFGAFVHFTPPTRERFPIVLGRVTSQFVRAADSVACSASCDDRCHFG